MMTDGLFCFFRDVPVCRDYGRSIYGKSLQNTPHWITCGNHIGPHIKFFSLKNYKSDFSVCISVGRVV